MPDHNKENFASLYLRCFNSDFSLSRFVKFLKGYDLSANAFNADVEQVHKRSSVLNVITSSSLFTFI